MTTVNTPMADFSDRLGRARAGDGAALGELLASAADYLQLLARLQIKWRLQGKVDAADVVQDVCLEAHRHFPGFRGHTEAEFIAWLRQILAARMANVVRHYLGTRGRDARLERELAEEADRSSRVLDGALADPQSTPSAQASKRERGVALADALSRLPPDYREAVILRNLEGLSFPDAAQRMGRSVDSVQKLWVRALAKLRDELGGIDL
ncbi:MAG: sigma-70 family RNA polymerase sigma factor [Gemmataceae bacterium]